MLLHLAYAAALVFGTTLIHAVCTVALLGWLRSIAKHHWALRSTLRSALVIAVLVLVMSLAAYVESALWAGLYWMVDALPNLPDALYFSLVTYTTLGYGDVTLGEDWRLLAAFEAANGIIMFGWTTAIIVAAVQRMFFHPSTDDAGS
jgi:voltage-gated potassium channel Kch